MTWRVCSQFPCPELTQTRWCPTHAREHEQQRGRPSQRGYDHAHTKRRAHYQARLDRGETFPCAKCQHSVTKHHDWHLGHTDDRRHHTGPEHAHCNLSEAGHKAHR